MNKPIEYIPQNESSIFETLNIVQLGIEKQDKSFYSTYKKAAQWGLESGLISYKSDSEINYEMRSKPWLNINREIKQNEKLSDVDNDYDTCINPS